MARWREGRGRRVERRAARVHRGCCREGAPSELSRPWLRQPSELSRPWLRRPTPGRSSNTAAAVRRQRPEPRPSAPAGWASGAAPSSARSAHTRELVTQAHGNARRHAERSHDDARARGHALAGCREQRTCCRSQSCRFSELGSAVAQCFRSLFLTPRMKVILAVRVDEVS